MVIPVAIRTDLQLSPVDALATVLFSCLGRYIAPGWPYSGITKRVSLDVDIPAYITPPAQSFTLRNIPVNTTMFRASPSVTSWAGAVGMIILALASQGLVAIVGSSRSNVIIERNPEISYPFHGDTVSVVWLMVIGFIVPMVPVAAVAPWTPPAWRAWLGVCAAGAVRGTAAAAMVTNVIKVMFMEQRPNFFAMCNYAGYADALESGDFTAYNAATSAGALGDISKCQADTSHVIEAQLSFPSGHASISSAGMVYLACFIYVAFMSRGAWLCSRARSYMRRRTSVDARLLASEQSGDCSAVRDVEIGSAQGGKVVPRSSSQAARDAEPADADAVPAEAGAAAAARSPSAVIRRSTTFAGEAQLTAYSALIWLLILACIALAGWVGATRVGDRMHRASDVAAGSALGAAVAFLSLRRVLLHRECPILEAVESGRSLLPV